LDAGDTNLKQDVYLRDRELGVTERVSMRNSTTQTNMDNTAFEISPDGAFISFVSADSGLVSGDTNNAADTFVVNSGSEPCSL
jgi:hypothetical protein